MIQLKYGAAVVILYGTSTENLILEDFTKYCEILKNDAIVLDSIRSLTDLFGEYIEYVVKRNSFDERVRIVLKNMLAHQFAIHVS